MTSYTFNFASDTCKNGLNPYCNKQWYSTAIAPMHAYYLAGT